MFRVSYCRMSNHKNIESTPHFRMRESIVLTLLASYLSFKESEAYVSTNYAKNTKSSLVKDDVSSAIASDTTKLGNLEVPNVGVGTISWSSEKCKSKHVVAACWGSRSPAFTTHHSLFWFILCFATKLQCFPWKTKNWKS